MGSVIALLPADGWPRLLCDAVWQSTLIAAFGWLTARFLVRQPAARAWVLLFSLTACVLAPLASMAARGSGWMIVPRGNDVELQAANAEQNLTAQRELVVERPRNNPASALMENGAVADAPSHRLGFQPDCQAERLNHAEMSPLVRQGTG